MTDAPAPKKGPYAWFYAYVINVRDPQTGEPLMTHGNECSRLHPYRWLEISAKTMRAGGQTPPVLLMMTPVSERKYVRLCKTLYGQESSPHDAPKKAVTSA